MKENKHWANMIHLEGEMWEAGIFSEKAETKKEKILYKIKEFSLKLNYTNESLYLSKLELVDIIYNTIDIKKQFNIIVNDIVDTIFIFNDRLDINDKMLSDEIKLKLIQLLIKSNDKKLIKKCIAHVLVWSGIINYVAIIKESEIKREFKNIFTYRSVDNFAESLFYFFYFKLNFYIQGKIIVFNDYYLFWNNYNHFIEKIEQNEKAKMKFEKKRKNLLNGIVAQFEKYGWEENDKEIQLKRNTVGAKTKMTIECLENVGKLFEEYRNGKNENYTNRLKKIAKSNGYSDHAGIINWIKGTHYKKIFPEIKDYKELTTPQLKQIYCNKYPENK